MGSWNATCGISKLPIYCGDEVVDFLIGEVAPTRDCGFICYPNDLYSPIIIQTYGTYDDYGEIDPVPGWHLDYIESVFRAHAAPLEQGDNTVHDHAVVPSELTYDGIQDLVHEGRLFLRIPPGHKHLNDDVRRESKNLLPDISNIRVSRMMVLKPVFDELVSWGMDTWSKGHVYLNDFVEDGLKLFHELHTEADEGLREIMRLRLLNLNTRENIFAAFLRTSESSDFSLSHRFENYLDLLANEIEKAAPNMEVVTEIITEMSKFMIFKNQMMVLQHLWSPQTGTQNHDLKLLQGFHNFCSDYARKKEQSFAEMWEGEDDAEND